MSLFGKTTAAAAAKVLAELAKPSFVNGSWRKPALSARALAQKRKEWETVFPEDPWPLHKVCLSAPAKHVDS